MTKRACFVLTCIGAANIPSATNQQNPSAVAVAQHNIRKIKAKFATLVTKSHRRLQNRGIKVEDIQLFLVTIYSSPNSRDGGDIVTTVVESAKSLEEIFRALSKYGLWDYLNYHLLQSIIEEFASDDCELKCMMEQYQKDLTGHALTMEIQMYLEATHYEFPVITTSDNENVAEEVVPPLPPQQKCNFFKKLSIKSKANVTDHSLNYVYNLWHSLANQFFLPRPAMILNNIAKGCIDITWLIPSNLVKHVTRKARETANMFAKQYVLRVMLEEQCIYSMEIESHLFESEASVLERKVCFVMSFNL